MRAFSCFLAASCLTLLAGASAWGADGILWESNFETALQKAAQQNRLVLVHFWGDGCIPCEAVERNVFPDAKVAQAVNGNYVAVKVHAQQRPDLVQRFDVQAWPTDVIITPAAQKVAHYISPQQASEYIQRVQEVAAREQSRGFGAPSRSFAQPASYGDAPANDRNSSFSGAGGAFAGAGESSQDGGVFPLRGSPQQGSFAQQRPFSPQDGIAGMNRGGPSGQDPRMAAHQGAIQPPQANGFPLPASPYGGMPAGGGPAHAAWPPGGAAPNMVHGAPSPHRPDNAFGQGHNGQHTANGFYSPPGSPLNPPAHAGAGPGAPPANPSAPSGPPTAMEGYCVVSLVEQFHLPAEQQSWKRGDKRWGAIHRGRTYLFVGPEEQKRFLANPDHYTPVLSGHDPVAFTEHGQLVDGRREHGVTYQGKIYLFSSEPNLHRFWSSPGAYITRVQQAMNVSPGQQPR
jgi:YHS domain-containing protein/thiol-disulfide isomerase/thioredoxin